jgi:hypothetical protein
MEQKNGGDGDMILVSQWGMFESPKQAIITLAILGGVGLIALAIDWIKNRRKDDDENGGA